MTMRDRLTAPIPSIAGHLRGTWCDVAHVDKDIARARGAIKKDVLMSELYSAVTRRNRQRGTSRRGACDHATHRRWLAICAILRPRSNRDRPGAMATTPRAMPRSCSRLRASRIEPWWISRAWRSRAEQFKTPSLVIEHDTRRRSLRGADDEVEPCRPDLPELLTTCWRSVYVNVPPTFCGCAQPGTDRGPGNEPLLACLCRTGELTESMCRRIISRLSPCDRQRRARDDRKSTWQADCSTRYQAHSSAGARTWTTLCKSGSDEQGKPSVRIGL